MAATADSTDAFLTSLSAEGDVLSADVLSADDDWKIEEIIATVQKPEGRYYKVKWVRYVWQPEETLQPLQQLLEHYWQTQDYTTNTKHHHQHLVTAAVVESTDISNQINLPQQQFDVPGAKEIEEVTNHHQDYTSNIDVNGERLEDIALTHPQFTTSGEVGSSSLVNEQGVIGDGEQSQQQHHDLSAALTLPPPSDATSVVMPEATNAEELPVVDNSDVFSTIQTFGKFTMNLGEMVKHFVCQVCGKSFGRKTSLQRHNLIHTGEKPWQCKYCEKTFNQNSILQRHLLIHCNPKEPYQCEICQKTFIEKTACRRHYETHSSTKSYKCEHCGKEFRLKEYLKKHEFLHKGVKPHKCKICERSFADSSAFKRHLATHDEKQQTFQCATCFKVLKNKRTLKQHQGKCKAPT